MLLSGFFLALPHLNVHYFESSDSIKSAITSAQLNVEGGSKKGEVFCLGHFGPAVSRFRSAVIEINVKQHKRKRGQTLKYHLKVQKKWNARFRKGDSRVMVYGSPATLVTNKALPNLTA